MKISKQCQPKKQRLKRLPVHVYLAYLLVCTLLLTGVSFSRYISSASGSDNARVAAGVVAVNHDETTTMEMDQDVGNTVQTRVFSFSVSNVQSEVAIRYDLVLELNQSLPNGVTISLYKNDDTNPLGTFSADSSTQLSIPNAGVFQAGVYSTDQYKLTFQGNFDIIDQDYDRIVNISVQAEQID